MQTSKSNQTEDESDTRHTNHNKYSTQHANHYRNTKEYTVRKNVYPLLFSCLSVAETKRKIDKD